MWEMIVQEQSPEFEADIAELERLLYEYRNATIANAGGFYDAIFLLVYAMDKKHDK